MKALLIIAHGSRRKDSNDEVRRLADRIRENSGPSFGLVVSAFLEISSPQMDSAIADLVDEGATDIMIFPYFLAAGIHVANDIPRIVEEEKANYAEPLKISFSRLPPWVAKVLDPANPADKKLVKKVAIEFVR